jgi:estrone sulfotransferase
MKISSWSNQQLNRLLFLSWRSGLFDALGFNRRTLPRKVYTDDIFLVSYPKSGNTWLRFLIGNALTNNQCNFNNIGSIIPDIYQNWEECDQISRPRIMKSHRPYTSKMKKVIYLVRDGRDVAVSYYFHLLKKKKLKRNIAFDEYLHNFNRGLVNVRLGSWNAHVLRWLHKTSGDQLVIKFEDLKKDTVTEFKKILNFIGLQKNEDEISSAITASDFKRMQALEQEQSAVYHDFVNTDSSISFMRAGKVGGWKEYFTKENEEEFLLRQGEALRLFNYVP